MTGQTRHPVPKRLLKTIDHALTPLTREAISDDAT